jgi:hypothetical protein
MVSERGFEDNQDEKRRRDKLRRYVSQLCKCINIQDFYSELDDLASILNSLGTQNKAAGFLAAEEDAALIQKYILQVDRALADYQVSCFVYSPNYC